MPRMSLRRLLFFIAIFLYGAVLYADTVSDSDLTAEVLKSYSNNILTNHLEVNVTTQNGVVAITANANPQQAVALIEVAESVKGVVDVNTAQLTTASGSLPFDMVVTAKVRGTLVREKVFGDNITLDNFPITVKTTNGIVYFFGVAPSYPQILKAIDLTYKVPGVQRVISSLGVPFQKVYMGT